MMIAGTALKMYNVAQHHVATHKQRVIFFVSRVYPDPKFLTDFRETTVYTNYFYDTSVIFSNYIITYRGPFTICIAHDRRTDVIGID